MAKMTFESAMERLEEIADLLEDGSKSLEESLKLFEESNELMIFCQKKLAEAENKITVLSKTADGFQLSDREAD
jgi:exodeoxyribonuclease VII small subunit